MDISQKTLGVIKRSLARASHLEYIKYCWPYSTPYLVGLHTRTTCSKIDEAFRRYRHGLSSFIIITMPPRHGKSEMVSVNLPPHFLGEFPEDEVLTVGHAAKLAYKFSRQSRQIVSSKKHRRLYPNCELSKSASNIEAWNLSNNMGRAQYAGIVSGVAGLGGSLIIIDDYFGNRADAESETISQKVWEEITDNIINRMPNKVILIILATRWHVNDPIGRILERLGKEGFPHFDVINFPAMSDEYETGTLFPERFDLSYYLARKAIMSEYGWSSLMQNEPVRRGGNIFKTDCIKIVDELPDNLRFMRAWDLASSEKQTQKDDPDWTIGLRGSMVYHRNKHGADIPTIYIDHVERMREEAPERNRRIRSLAEAERTVVGVEGFGAYKDAYTTLKRELKGVCVVRKLNPPGDKIAKAEPLEAIIEGGNFILKRGPWNEPFIKCLSQFAGGAHDDDVDAAACLYYMFEKKSSAIGRRIGI